ncbi:elongation factor G, partial [bacterium]|nr:elongation factor G [bacterium]
SAEDLKGVVSLTKMKAIYFPEGTAEEGDIPAEMMADVEQARHDMLEALSDFDDELAEKFLEEAEITPDDVRRVVRKAVLGLKIIPCFCGSAYKNVGVQPLLDAIVDYLPNPHDHGSVKGVNPDNPEEVLTRESNSEEPFCALAFKIIHDQFVGQQTFVRTYSGILKPGDALINTTNGKKERVGRIMRVHAKERVELEQVGPGDIVALIGMKDTHTGHTLCDPANPILLEKITIPESVISVKVSTKTPKELEKLHSSLRKMALEDPSFSVRVMERTNETVIAGMGELHLEIIVDRLRTEHKVEAIVGAPSVEYREAISKEVRHRYKHVKQTGGRGQFADTEIIIEPNPDGEFEFVDEITGGVIPREFINPVKSGIEDVLKNGVLADYPVVGVKVRLVFGSFHPVDSSEQAFKTCGAICFKEAFKKADPKLLEPIMALEINTPDDYVGDVVGDLNRRRGRVQEMSKSREGSQRIKGEAPLMELFGYATSLRSASSGRANYSMEVARYEPLPANIQAEVLEEARKRIEGEQAG